jgi:hypothetical protein
MALVISMQTDDEKWLAQRSLAPGYSVSRIVALIRRSIADTGLDLTGLTVLTEAATGAYGVTPVIAAMAGAECVYAFARPGRYGSISDVKTWTAELAKVAGIARRISVVEETSPDILRQVDIVTNSGHLRPITAGLIDHLPNSAVVALMFEAWEFRPQDIDFAACARRSIPIVGVNERHAALDVFSYLGPLCVKQLFDCGFAVYGNRIGLLCDNAFGSPIAKGLRGLGANVELFLDVGEIFCDAWDLMVVALQPTVAPRIGREEAGQIAAVTPRETAVIQFWGDVDREALTAHGLRTWPFDAPDPGHMAALLSDIGPEPIIRLQTGGLRAAECIFRGEGASTDGFAELVTCG